MAYIGAGIYFWQKNYIASMQNIEQFGGMIFVFYILENNAWKNGSKDAFGFKLSELPLYYQLIFATALCFAIIPVIMAIAGLVSCMIKY